MSTKEHKAEAPDAVSCFVLTVSDTRTLETDKSGNYIATVLKENGHRVSGHKIVKDDADAIRSALQTEIQNSATQIVIITGGTGIGPRDVTADVVESLLVKVMPGFGELFRHFSYDEIGAATILSRAIGGVAANDTLIFATPGSSAAVRLAMEKILLPELTHFIREVSPHLRK